MTTWQIIVDIFQLLACLFIFFIIPYLIIIQKKHIAVLREQNQVLKEKNEMLERLSPKRFLEDLNATIALYEDKIKKMQDEMEKMKEKLDYDVEFAKNILGALIKSKRELEELKGRIGEEKVDLDN